LDATLGFVVARSAAACPSGADPGDEAIQMPLLDRHGRSRALAMTRMARLDFSVDSR